MKAKIKNLGFALPAAVLIIFGLLVVGGGIYFATTNNKNVDVITENNNELGETSSDMSVITEDQDSSVETGPVSSGNGIKVGVSLGGENNCTPNTQPWIKIISPNGGEDWRIGQTYTVNWDTCNTPANSWLRLSYSIPSGVGDIHYSRDCFGEEQVLASQGNYNWTISSSVFGCSDAGYTFPPDTSFQTKIKTELYTGVPFCDGFPNPNSPCSAGTRTLHAQDESDNNFSISNLP
ncbi:MAG: hypothetical protein K9M36_01640 [Candidatus Pacebacteria bacterium]|nr:hypothetical protein [Candidatus Paceibacterota bacterium]